MIKVTKHFQERLNERFTSNNINKHEYILNTFKDAYKKYKKGKIYPKIKETQNEYGKTYKMYLQEFVFIYSIIDLDVYLITFGVRINENNINYKNI